MLCGVVLQLRKHGRCECSCEVSAAAVGATVSTLVVDACWEVEATNSITLSAARSSRITTSLVASDSQVMYAERRCQHVAPTKEAGQAATEQPTLLLR
jgi:hypothetical protein